MANTIKIKRGLSSNIDNTTLAQGELAITTDTNELYVGVEGGKKKLGSDVVIIYDTDDESTVVKKLAEATDGPDLTGNPAKIKKECIYYEIGAPEWSRIYKLVYIASTVVDSPHTSVTFSGGYGELTMKIERGEKVNGEYQYTITKTTDSYEQTSNKIDEIGVKPYVSSSEYPSEKAVVDYVNERVVQSDYNQNDSTASDYIKNRPFYSEWNEFFNQEVSFSYKSITQDNKTYYQLSSNEFDYTFDFDSLLKTTSFIISINEIKHDLPVHEFEPGIKIYANYFVTEIAELTEDCIGVQFDDQGKMQIMIYTLNEPLNSEDLNKTIILSKETVHKIENKFVEHPLDFTDENAVVGTTYEGPTFVLEKHWNETHTHYHTTLELYSAGIIEAE